MCPGRGHTYRPHPRAASSAAPADPAAEKPTKPASKKKVAGGTEGSVEIVKAKSQPAEEPSADVDAGDVDITGSLPQPEVKEPQPAKQKSQFAVELGSAQSTDLLRNRWDLISQLHPELLNDLVPRAAKSADNDTVKLLAGPFASEAKAKAEGKKLAELNLPCSVGGFKGEAL